MTNNDNQEKNQRTKYIDITANTPLPARGWQTQYGLAARARETAVRQATVASATMTRYEERKLLRTELEHAAYDRYYATVDLAAELELDYTPPRPGADDTLSEYTEARDTFLEMLANELTTRRETIVGQEIVVNTMTLQTKIATYENCGAKVELPTKEAPNTFAEIVGWHNAWKQAFELAQIEYRRIQLARQEEWAYVHAHMRDMQSLHSAWRAPELREELEAIIARGVLSREDLRSIERDVSSLEYIYRQHQRDEARKQAAIRAEFDGYARMREASRQQEIAFRKAHPPLITALRLIAEEEPTERRFEKRNERTGKKKIYTVYFLPRRFKRYEERMERLAHKITRAHQGVHKILCKKINWKHMKSGHTGAQADPRRDWRRERSTLVGD